MMEYVEMLDQLKNNIDLYLIILLSISLVSSLIDWLFGWLNATFNKNVSYISNMALYGIIKKMMYFMVLILFGVVALAIIPHELSIPAISTLYIGYIYSEIHSILSHLNITEDGKNGELFITFLKNIFKGGNSNG